MVIVLRVHLAKTVSHVLKLMTEDGDTRVQVLVERMYSDKDISKLRKPPVVQTAQFRPIRSRASHFCDTFVTALDIQFMGDGIC